MSKDIGKNFMEKTKYKYLADSDQQQGLPQPPLQLPFNEEEPLIDLPETQTLSITDMNLTEAIAVRKSLRRYKEDPLTLEELSYLLWCTQGVKEVTKRPATLRTVPSAGSRHCFETYLLINKVEGLAPGLYRYLAIEHKLMPIHHDEQLVEKVTASCLGQVMVKQSAVTFIWTAVAYRMMWRYGERGYRYMHLDAGHVCQNLYLAAEAIDSGVCAIAAFEDEAINGLIGVDGEDQFVIYVATVGKKN